MRKFVSSVLHIFKAITIESDEDSCMGMGFVEGRISEDWFYSLKSRIERRLRDEC